MEDKIKEFVEETRNDIEKGDLVPGEYGIMVFTTKRTYYLKSLKFVFKNIDEFEEKASRYLNDISPEFGIEIESWKYD
jgi:DNA gyrase inhibitor GyrI